MEKLWNLSKTAVPMEKLWNFRFGGKKCVLSLRPTSKCSCNVCCFGYHFSRPSSKNLPGHRIRSIQNDQQAIRDSSVIFVAPYWSYRISCLKVQLAPLAQGADSEK